MSSTLRVRRAAESDVSAIAGVHVRSWQRAYRGQIPDAVLDALDVEQRAALWLALLRKPGHILHVAVRGERVAGFCSFIRSRDPDGGSDGEIAALYVEPAHWRSGIGRELLLAALDVGRSSGYRAVTLWVLASNTHGRRFYERCGFAPDGETKTENLAGHDLVEVRYRHALLAPAHE